MMPLLFYLIVDILKSFCKKKTKDVHTGTGSTYRVKLSDLDENFHLNNSRYLQYMQRARWELMIRSGFLQLALKRKWFGPIVSTKIIYLKPLKALQKFQVSCRIAFIDGEWIYMEQKATSGQVLHAVGYFKSKIKHGRSTVTPRDVFAALAADFPWEQETPAFLKQWHAADKEEVRALKFS